MKNLRQFLYFCRLQLATGDYDAHIPFLKGLVTHAGLGKEEAVWLGLLYMGYYSEGSAWVAFCHPGVRRRRQLPPAGLPITTQRRNLYGGKITRHYADLLTRAPFDCWLRQAVDWQQLLALVGSVWGNGRWAAYTTGELLTHLAGLGYAPTTYEVATSSGPRKGLLALGLPATEAGAATVQQELAKAGMDVPASVLESLLCDWAGMNNGTFYAGRNIDRQQGRILQVQALVGHSCASLWAVRRRVFPVGTLGELNGWLGIDKKRLRHYKEAGAVLAPEEDRCV